MSWEPFDWDVVKWSVNWTDISYTHLDVDMSKFYFDFYHPENDAVSMLKCNIPTIKTWTITANQHVNSWLLPDDSKITIDLKNIDIFIATGLKMNDKGYIQPYVYDVKLNFG